MKKPNDFNYDLRAFWVERIFRIPWLFFVAYTTLPLAPIPLSFSVNAEIVRNYVPPDSPSPQRTKGAGSRGGCPRYTNTKFHLLAPDDHVAVTVSDPPSIFAYVSKPGIPFVITIAESNAISPLYEKNLTSTRSGIIKIELSKNKPWKMKAGRKYRWTLSLLCNKKRLSENPYAQVEFKYVSPSPDLQRELQFNPSERAEIYAREGIWYDALASSYQNAISTNQNGKTSNSNYFAYLLQEIGVRGLANGR